MEDDYEDYEEEDDREQLILTIGDDGKPTIKKESDYVSIEEKDMDLIRGFIEENKKLFNEYIKKQKDKKQPQKESNK